MTPLTASQHISTIPRKKRKKAKMGGVVFIINVDYSNDATQKNFQGEERDVRNIQSASSIRSCKVKNNLHQRTERFSHGGCCANCDWQIVQKWLSLKEKKSYKLNFVVKLILRY
jgi:hypothetical protein